MALESTQVGRGARRTSFMNVKDFMAIDALAGRKGTPVEELLNEVQASLAGPDSAPLIRLFRGYCD